MKKNAFILVGFALLSVLLAVPPVADAAERAPAKKDKPGYQIGERLKLPNATDAEQYKTIEWDALIPRDWDAMRAFQGMDLEKLSDADPRAMDALEQMRRDWDAAPVVEKMNNARVRIAGFVVPLEADRKQMTEFLLVPYFGACIHVPPPPANQVIHVTLKTPVSADLAMDAVWVSGVLEAAYKNSSMGSAGYRIKAVSATPYREPK